MKKFNVDEKKNKIYFRFVINLWIEKLTNFNHPFNEKLTISLSFYVKFYFYNFL